MNCSGITNWPSLRIDAAHMTGQDLSRNGQPGRQHHAHTEGANARRDWAYDREFGSPAEFAGGDHERRAPAALFAADAGIEVGPDQIPGFGQVGHWFTRRSRGLCPVPSRMPRALPPGSPPPRAQTAHTADARAPW